MEMYEKTSENLNKNIFILLSKISWGQQWWRKMKYCSLSLKWAFRGHILEENLISEEDISEEDISEEDILRRIFWGGYSEEDILRRTFWGGHSKEDILRRTFWEGHSEEDILRRTFWGGHFSGGYLWTEEEKYKIFVQLSWFLFKISRFLDRSTKLSHI